MHYLLIYDVADDYLERRAAFRAEHLALAWAAHERGELHEVQDDAAVGPATFDLGAGPHNLTIAYREDGARLDRLLLTNDLTFTPAAAF